jgi:MFS transporter, OFA family, oxalate/formate antiporter
MTTSARDAATDSFAAARYSARRGQYVVAGAFSVMLVTFGSAYSFSAFFDSLQQAFSASRGEVSLIFSIAVPLYFLSGAVSGPLADRFGARPVCLFAVGAGSAGLIFASTATALWQIYVGFGLGLGLGIGFSFVPSIAAVQRWFVHRRGAASGIAIAGIGFGTLLMPLIASDLIARIGWRGAWVVLGLCILVIGGVAAFFVDNSPERHGLLPDGGVAGIGASAGRAPVAGASLRQAVASRSFVLLYLAHAAIWIGTFIPFVHLVPYAEDHGLSRATAVAIFGLVGIGSTAGRFLLGSAADRLGRRRLLAAIFVVMALMQMWWLTATTAWQLAVFALVFGTCYGGFVAIYPSITVDHFGGRNASGIIGVLYTGAALGTFLGPKLAGDAFDVFGSYTVPIAIGAGFALLAAAIMISLPEPPAAAPSPSPA